MNVEVKYYEKIEFCQNTSNTHNDSGAFRCECVLKTSWTTLGLNNIRANSESDQDDIPGHHFNFS